MGILCKWLLPKQSQSHFLFYHLGGPAFTEMTHKRLRKNVFSIDISGLANRNARQKDPFAASSLV